MIASYRLQFNPAFTFQDAQNSLDYFKKLGISHLYASPILQPVTGSTHGYDVVNPNEINKQLGDFEKLQKNLKKKGMGWIQDIVPNHMSFHNEYLHDVFRYGKNSRFYNMFDIDWNHPDYKGKVMAPFLGKPLTKAIKDNEINIMAEDELKIAYFDHKFPVSFETYNYILRLLKEKTKNPKSRVMELCKNNIPEVLNQNIGKILAFQHFRLEYWKEANKKINYRRFFSVNDLICLNPNKFFHETHALIHSLADKYKIDALRIDHIDGLNDPKLYVKKLKKHFTGKIYAEKILEKEEALPHIDIDGTTGYDFLNYSNWLFVKKDKEKKFSNYYKEFTGNNISFARELVNSKKKVIDTHFSGDLDNLTRYFSRYMNCDKIRLRKTIREILASFPVYRTYISHNNKSKNEINDLLSYIKKAEKNALKKEFESVLDFFCKRSKSAIDCIMLLQQFTGPIMAKGLEDTSLYRYNRLLSLNEVGGCPSVFGISIEEFHEFNKNRQNTSMNATSTHDTKRGEDARARINVLSEIPDEFFEKINHWHKLTRSEIDKNTEYYLYQSMIGSWPGLKSKTDFKKRLKEHMLKAAREAKVHTCWLSPDLDYEKNLINFIDRIFNNTKFLQDFNKFHKRTSQLGMYNSYSQILLKCFSPGFPDFYRGSEIPDLNMVDPDNRRTVDFTKRKKLICENEYVYSSGQVKLQLIKRLLKIRKENIKLIRQGEYKSLEVSGEYKENIIAFAWQKGNQRLILIAPRFFSDISSRPLGNAWKDTAIKVKGKFTNQLTGDKINSDQLLYLKDVLKKWCVGVLR